MPLLSVPSFQHRLFAWWFTLCGALWSSGFAHAACPSWPTSSRFVIDGDRVTDQRTGLVWAHCSVGQSWNGNTCTGAASTMNHEDALRHAQSQLGWRLPQVKELAILADVGCINPAIDAMAFPVTPSAFFWTSTPYAEDFTRAMGVDFDRGRVLADSRSSMNFVRLVRANR